jgi:hypothetical protein
MAVNNPLSDEEIFLNVLEGKVYRIREAGSGTNCVTKEWLSFYEATHYPLLKWGVGYSLEKWKNGKWKASNWRKGN